MGRGLRICVDRNGVRQDAELLGEDFFEINELTVIANESFADFSKALQNEIMQTLRERPTRVDDVYLETFTNVELKTNKGAKRYVGNGDIEMLKAYLTINKYVDVRTHEPTDKYREASASNTLVPMPEDIADLSDTFKKIVDAVIDKDLLKEMLNDITGQKKTEVNKLNDNFNKEEFKALWNEINHKYVYTVTYDSDQLINKAVNSLNANLDIARPTIVVEEGKQNVTEDNKVKFEKTASESLTHFLKSSISENTCYDLVGRLASQTHLTRHTIIQILKGILPDKLNMFAWNPEQFISQVSNLIKAEKATMIVSHIEYSETKGKYDSNIFTLKSRGDFAKALKTKKHISDYVFFDSEKEKEFAKGLENGIEVTVYAKLPRTFQIPTPVGNYSPDWAIAFEHKGLKHIYFIAETKGTMDSIQFKKVEEAKIECANALFNKFSDTNVRYEQVDSFEKLREKLQKYMIEKIDQL